MKIIKEGKEARFAIKNGVDKASNKIKLTLGMSGRNVIIGRKFQLAEITNDGKTIAETIELEDEIENLGAEKVKEITIATYDKVFDGTTTATTLHQAFFNAGYDKLNQDDTFTQNSIDPIQVKNEIDIIAQKVCEELTNLAVPVTPEQIYDVAMSSVKVPQYARMIADIYNIIGKDGIITVEDSYIDTTSEIVDGFEIEAGFNDDIFANTEDKTYVLENPFILVTNNVLNFKEQISPITSRLNGEKIKDIVIVSDNFSKEIIQSFMSAKISNVYNIIPIKTPFFGKKERMEDIAIALGATFYDKDSNLVLADAIQINLGKATKIVVDKDKTVIIGAKGDTKSRIEILKKELAKSKTKFDTDQLTKRIAKLNGSIGIIRVASTETDRTYLKKKINNAINTTKFAIQEGVIKGGGMALKNISEKMSKNLLTEALLSPYNTIQKNAGGSLEIGDNVIDAVKTTKTAVQIASNLAGLLLTVEVAIADKYEKPKDFKDED